MKLSLLSCIGAVLGEQQFTEAQLKLARKHIRQQIVHHTQATGGLVDEFVEKLLDITVKDTENNHKLEDWSVEHETVSLEGHGDDVIKTTVLSPAFKLKTGNAHFTINSLYRVPVPEGDHIIVNQVWELAVGPEQKPVALSEMYNHHWLIGGEGPLDLCEGDYFFGGGAEYRTMDYTFPPGYGQARISASNNCGANFHFINTQDLLLEWEGFNNPNGSHAAAAQLCAECGWEPTRADGLCEKWADGSFLCCFTESRCRVNNPKDKSTQDYRMKGTFYYKRDFTGYKFGQLNLFDIGGNARTERGQMLDEIAEWNVAANLNNEGVHSHCNATVCTMSETVTIGDGSRFGYGMCAGDMLWSYIHVHAGTLGGNIHVNGEHKCDVNPKIGKDPSMTPGDEQGYLVGMTMCVDYRATGEKLRLNRGDKITATAYYDVDKKSTRYFPSPGGKHGGIMGLFFAVIDCDEGTWNEVYVRRNDTCVSTPRSKSDRVGTFYNDRASCEAQTNPQNPTVPQLAPPEPDTQAESTVEPNGGKVDLIWKDCGSPSKKVNITKVTPDSMGIGLYSNIEAFGVLSEDVESATFSLKMSSGGFGLTLMDFGGDACNGKVGKWTLVDQIHLTWFPMKCPIKAGDFSTHLRLFVDPAVPVSIAHTTTTVLVHDQDGAEIACAEVVTQGQAGQEMVV